MVSSVAYAADNATAQASSNPNPPIEREGIPIIGLVTNIGTSQFTVQDRRGVDRVLLVTSITRFTTLNGAPASFSDLQLYEWVLVTMAKTGEETIQVRGFILLPTDFNPSLIEQRSRGDGSYLATEVAAASRVHTSTPSSGQTRSRTRTQNSSRS
jgi:hypothetical protein